MNTPRRFVPAAFVAAVCISLLTGCATSDPTPSADSPTVSALPSGDNGAAGIQLAMPSDAPNPAVAAKRRAPEAVGTVASVVMGEDSVQVVFTPDAGYEYYAGTTFDIPFSAATAIDGEVALVLGDLTPGDRINVWTGACRESMPVQCDVEAATAAL